MLDHIPRVCYLRGSYLNPFETQYLTPLQGRFDITLGHPTATRFDVSSISLDKQAFPCIDFANGLIPRVVAGVRVPNPLKFAGYEEVLVGMKHRLEGFDIVHVPEQHFYFTHQAAQFKDELGFKLIVTQCEVNPYPNDHWEHVVRRMAAVRERTDLFLARTDRARAALITEGVERERVMVVGHGVDLERFHSGPASPALREELGIEPDRLIILFVGRLVWTKGLWAMADCAARMRREPDLAAMAPLFLVVGDGEDRIALQKRLHRLGVDDMFLFVGNQPYHRIPEFHRLADVFTMPSISTRMILEQFGIALIEAMATGTAVVSTHCGGIDEVVGDAGLLVQPNDSYRLFEALARLCREKDYREELGRRGRQRVVEHFSHQIIADKLANAYQRVLAV